MKLIHLFKKETTNSKKVSVQKLEKTQLEKVIGGGDGNVDKTKSNSTSTRISTNFTVA